MNQGKKKNLSEDAEHVQKIDKRDACYPFTDQILAKVDILVAIDYYGTTELLDIIGEENLRTHLNYLSALVKTER